MNQIEELKNKIQKLVNQYNFGNYKLVIQEVNILLKKLPFRWNRLTQQT